MKKKKKSFLKRVNARISIDRFGLDKETKKKKKERPSIGINSIFFPLLETLERSDRIRVVTGESFQEFDSLRILEDT